MQSILLFKKMQKAVLKTFVIFTGKHLCWIFFLIKLEAFGNVVRLTFTHTLKIFFSFKLNLKKFHQLSTNYVLENVKCKVMFTEAYLEPNQTSAMELFCENS